MKTKPILCPNDCGIRQLPISIKIMLAVPLFLEIAEETGLVAGIPVAGRFG
jgi:hypothetical protein